MNPFSNMILDPEKPENDKTKVKLGLVKKLNLN
jgi:hypothetical protein